MDSYHRQVQKEIELWKKSMMERTSLRSQLAAKIQVKINKIIPQRFHKAIAAAVKNMVKTVIAGSQLTARKLLPAQSIPLIEREIGVKEKINHYKKIGAATGAGAGAGGFLLSVAEFPRAYAFKDFLLTVHDMRHHLRHRFGLVVWLIFLYFCPVFLMLFY